MYEQVYSFVLVTISRTIYVHIPNHRSAFLVGLKHAIISLICGPWSWMGPFETVRALITNLSGGIDVTHMLGSRPDGVYLPVEELEANAQRKVKAIQYGYATVLLAVLGILIWKIVLPVFDPSIWPLDFVLLTVSILILGVTVGFILRKDR